jgi:undecaprenyl diphosphate synthase
MIENNVPLHVAIIMDGNGRWAQQRHLPRTQGHVEGAKRVEELVEAAHKLGVKFLTLYTFSTENWNRPESEVSMLMSMMVNLLEQKLNKLHENNVRFMTIGQPERVPSVVRKTLDKAIEQTRHNAGLTVNLAFNYGARQEIVHAVRDMAREVQEGKLAPDQITEETISQHLFTKGLPDPDLLIRTSGEIRISNFLLWQLSYAEFYFTEKMWPEFTPAEFEKALQDFQQRQRRFGGIGMEEKAR